MSQGSLPGGCIPVIHSGAIGPHRNKKKKGGGAKERFPVRRITHGNVLTRPREIGLQLICIYSPYGVLHILAVNMTEESGGLSVPQAKASCISLTQDRTRPIANLAYPGGANPSEVNKPLWPAVT